MMAKKGLRGYRKSRKKQLAMLVSFFCLAIILQLLARMLVDNSAARNILTVMAILTVLPMANLASPLIASWRVKEPEKELFQQMKMYEEKAPILYELMITSKEFILPVDAAFVHPKGLILYCPGQKPEEKKAEAYLNEMLRGQKLNPNAKVIKDRNAFIRRLEGMKPASDYEDDGSTAHVTTLLKAISM